MTSREGLMVDSERSNRQELGLISKQILLEDLVREYPQAVRLLMERGIRCLACGEPMWGTLESAAVDKSFTAAEIDLIVDELNAMISEHN